MFDAYEILDALANNAEQQGRLDDMVQAVCIWAVKRLNKVSDMPYSETWFFAPNNKRDEIIERMNTFLEPMNYCIMRTVMHKGGTNDEQ